jgi:hypothetical protein
LRTKNDSDLENAVLRTLSYFDIFNYPLKASEVLNFLDVSAVLSEVEQALKNLTIENQVTHHGELYSLQSDDSVFDRRHKGNGLAERLLPQVKKRADFIFQFPFVRSVMASGSLSKNFMDEKSDFDFFIVCASKRLWISRTLLVLFKKIFLKNSHRHFCVNYFIGESDLEIDEKNIFTATELATVLPLTGSDHYTKLMSANHHWMTQQFPNFQQRSPSSSNNTDGIFKLFFEKSINLFFGDNLNEWFKQLTINRWKKIYGHLYSPKDFNLAFKSTDSVSKNHPQNFQKRVVEEFNSRAARLKRKVEVYE